MGVGIVPKTENIKQIKKELSLLRSFVIGVIGKDKEGGYRPEFVKKILKIAGEKPERIFMSAQAFLKDIRRVG